jgi:hypothetical protein
MRIPTAPMKRVREILAISDFGAIISSEPLGGHDRCKT